MYNEQYAKGIIHLVVFAVLVSLADNHDIFGLFIAGWIFYMAIEAYHTAAARRDGRPLPNPFGLNDIGERLGFGKAWSTGGQHRAACLRHRRSALHAVRPRLRPSRSRLGSTAPAAPTRPGATRPATTLRLSHAAPSRSTTPPSTPGPASPSAPSGSSSSARSFWSPTPASSTPSPDASSSPCSSSALPSGSSSAA